MVFLSQQDKLRRARIILEKKVTTAPEFIRPVIGESWNRCLEQGLSPRGKPEKGAINSNTLEKLLEKNRLVHSLALVEMKSLYQQIAGTNFMILLADSDGIVLDRMLDRTWSAKAAIDFEPGQIWSEAVRGTNALGVAAITRLPTTVHAGEHFFSQDGCLTCTAVPITDPNGEIVAILDAASDCRSRQYHTMALVKMSCLTIENGLFQNYYRDMIIIELHNRSEFLGTLHAGLLAFDEDCKLVSVNCAARNLLEGITLSLGVLFSQIFEKSPKDFRNSPQFFLTDQTGSTFAVKISRNMQSQIWGPHGFSPPVYDMEKSVTNSQFVFSDSKLQSALQMIKRAVTLKAPILILGETGTGKEALARFAHEASNRRGDFVAINCAALPDSLVESELFGYAGGAFTGSSKTGASGLIQQAHEGTLFLDEIGEIPLTLQAKLLRFLDQWTIRPVGSIQDQVIDVQLVSATNCNLSLAISEGRFRADLFYRINTICIKIPPLRERSDIREIILFLSNQLDNSRRLSEQAFDSLASYKWPGNIREMKNLITRLFILGDGKEILQEDINILLETEDRENPPDNSLSDHVRNMIYKSYKHHQGNISAVARDLNISRNKVYKKLKEFKECRPKQK